MKHWITDRPRRDLLWAALVVVAALGVRSCSRGPELVDVPGHSLYARVVAVDEQRGQATVKLVVMPRETSLVLDGQVEAMKRLKQSGEVVKFTIRDNQVEIADGRYRIARLVWTTE